MAPEKVLKQRSKKMGSCELTRNYPAQLKTNLDVSQGRRRCGIKSLRILCKIFFLFSSFKCKGFPEFHHFSTSLSLYTELLGVLIHFYSSITSWFWILCIFTQICLLSSRHIYLIGCGNLLFCATCASQPTQTWIHYVHGPLPLRPETPNLHLLHSSLLENGTTKYPVPKVERNHPCLAYQLLCLLQG